MTAPSREKLIGRLKFVARLNWYDSQEREVCLDAADALEADQKRIAELEERLRECADDLKNEVEGRYLPDDRDAYPHIRKRFDRDMEPVLRAYAVLPSPPAGVGDGAH